MDIIQVYLKFISYVTIYRFNFEDRKKEKESLTPMFGVQLVVAIERSNNYDGINLPLIVRNCIDYIEEFGNILLI